MNSTLTHEHEANESKLNSLTDIVLQQYQHIFDKEFYRTLPSESIIEHIVRYYEDIIGCMPGNVYWLDKRGIAVGCNQNVLAMFGLSELCEFKGLSFEDMGRIGKWTPEATHAFKHDTLSVIQSGLPILNTEEPPIPNAEGTMTYFLTSRVPLFDRQKNVIGIVGISIDISEHKKTQAALQAAKEEAEAASHAKSEFVANMSHDLKTPLASIIGVAELLSSRLKERENIDFAKSILMAGRQLLSFVDNCLQIFKLESVDSPLSNERFSLKEIFVEMSELFMPAIRTKDLAFQFDYDENIPPTLFGCRANLYRILLNLVGNAVKFTHHGHIKISATLDELLGQEAKIQIKVEDTGIGIPKDQQHKIFDHFTRLIPSYKGIYEGSGIGLYIVKKFVTAMNGQIHVNSEEGVGSEFVLSFIFPVHVDETDQLCYSTSLSETKSFAKTHKTIKILLVEDNLIAQRMQSALFQSVACCAVDVVDCGEVALQVFEPGKYDLIIMDIGLPGLQGNVVSERIRQLERHTQYHVPIIALTAHGAEELSQEYHKVDIQDVFNKPILREQAEKIIQCYLPD
jgi:PAS domain S-box-containing protein